MASLLTDEQKSQAESLLNDLHDTYKKKIFYFKEREVLTLSASSNFNYIYGEDGNDVNKTTEIVSGYFMGRILWLDPIAKKYPNFTYQNENIPMLINKNIARLKVDVQGYEIIKNSKQIKLPDDRIYKVQSSPKPIGAFDNLNYYSILLESLE